MSLLSGLKLSRARTWLVAHPLQMTLAERQFIEASIAFHEAEVIRRERLRNRVLRGAITSALVLAVVAGIAVWQYRSANLQRNRAQAAVTDATKTANTLIFDMAQKFRNRGLPVNVTRSILDLAQQLQHQLIESGETAPDVRRADAAALEELADTLLAEGETKAALDAAQRSCSMMITLAADLPGNDRQRDLVVSDAKVGDVRVAQGNLPQALKLIATVR